MWIKGKIVTLGETHAHSPGNFKELRCYEFSNFSNKIHKYIM
jgi:hypothetical protein